MILLITVMEVLDFFILFLFIWGLLEPFMFDFHWSVKYFLVYSRSWFILFILWNLRWCNSWSSSICCWSLPLTVNSSLAESEAWKSAEVWRDRTYCLFLFSRMSISCWAISIAWTWLFMSRLQHIKVKSSFFLWGTYQKLWRGHHNTIFEFKERASSQTVRISVPLLHDPNLSVAEESPRQLGFVHLVIVSSIP